MGKHNIDKITHPISVTVGICALNEEKTILNVIRDVFRQVEVGWELVEVRVYSDGSSDKTVSEALAHNDKRLHVIDGAERKGKTARLQELFNQAQGEIIVMFDADIHLIGVDIISKLVNSLNEPRVVLVGGNSRPLSPKTFFQKAVYGTFRIFYSSRLQIKNGHNIFGATGSIMAGKKRFLQSFTFPAIINEDAYIYMTCISQGYVFRYVDDAIIEYTLPTNARDYMKQVVRSEPGSVSLELHRYFGDAVEKEFYRPRSFYIRAVLQECFRNPIGILYIIFLNILSRAVAPRLLQNYSLDWFTAHSTHE